MVTNETVSTPALYRLHLKTSCEDRAGIFRFCEQGGFPGVGWGVRDGRQPTDWAAYQAGMVAQDGRVPSSVRALHDLPDAALIWTRDVTRGVYYLAQVTGPWRYLDDADACHYDVRNVRPVRRVSCGVASRVPGSVKSAFILGQAIQRVGGGSDSAARFSASLFATLTGRAPAFQASLDDVLRTCLDAQDLEDLVYMYLQQRLGYLALPGSRSAGMPSYEYVLSHPDGHEGVVQVKRGASVVPRDAGSLPTGEVAKVYVFSTSGSYGPDPAANVTIIGFSDLVDFMADERSCLPSTVAHWVSTASGHGETEGAQQQ